MPKLRSVLSSWIFKIGWRGGDKPRSFRDSWCVGRSCGIDHNPVIRRAFGALRDGTGRRTMEPWAACLFAPPEA